MPLICKVVKKLEELNSSALTLGFPDESGPQVTVSMDPLELDLLHEGQTYALPFTPAPAVTKVPNPPTPAKDDSATVANAAGQQGDSATTPDKSTTG